MKGVTYSLENFLGPQESRGKGRQRRHLHAQLNPALLKIQVFAYSDSSRLDLQATEKNLNIDCCPPYQH